MPIRDDATVPLDRLLVRWPDSEAVMSVSELSVYGVLATAQQRGLTVRDDP